MFVQPGGWGRGAGRVSGVGWLPKLGGPFSASSKLSFATKDAWFSYKIHKYKDTLLHRYNLKFGDVICIISILFGAFPDVSPRFPNVSSSLADLAFRFWRFWHFWRILPEILEKMEKFKKTAFAGHQWTLQTCHAMSTELFIF